MRNQIHYGNAIALNSALPADGTPLTVQLSPFGEFALHDGGKMNGAVQHCCHKVAFAAHLQHKRKSDLGSGGSLEQSSVATRTP